MTTTTADRERVIPDPGRESDLRRLGIEADVQWRGDHRIILTLRQQDYDALVEQWADPSDEALRSAKDDGYSNGYNDGQGEGEQDGFEAAIKRVCETIDEDAELDAETKARLDAILQDVTP